MGWFGQKDFNFSDYIVEELGFKLISNIDNQKVFIKGDHNIIVYQANREYDKGSDYVLVSYKSENILIMKFIPNSSTVTQYLIKQAISTNVLRK